MTNTIVLKQELQDAVYNCRTAKNKAQDALNKLFKLADFPTPSTLAEVTAQRLATFVGERCAAVQKSPIHTAEQKDKIINDWIEWKTKAMPHVAAVETFVKEWQDVSPVLDTATMTIYTSDITESLTPRSTAHVPIQAYRHLALIEDVRKAINELREWEKQQDTKKIPLDRLLAQTEKDLLQSWANGTIKVNHDQEDAFSIRWRESVYAATL